MSNLHSNSLDHLKWLLPEHKKSLSVRETAKILGKSTQFVRDAFRSGKIQGFALEGGSLKDQIRASYLIPSQNLLCYLHQHANYGPADYRHAMIDLFSKASKTQLQYFKEYIDSLIAKQPSLSLNPQQKN